MAGPQSLYLGDPAGTFGLQKLPSGFELDTSLDRSITVNRNISGATVTVRRRPVMRPYTLSWEQLDEDQFDLVDGFYAGLHGDGPFCLVDPSIVNQLPLSASVFDYTDGWTPSAGTLSASSTAGPTGVRSKVAAWASATSTGFLRLADPDLVRLPPVLAGFTHAFSLYVRTASSTCNVALAIQYGSTETPSGTGVTGSTTGITTTWQKLSVSVASTSLTGLYAIPALKSLSSTPPDILVAAAGFYYDSVPSAWRSGRGVPRVSLVDASASPVSFFGARGYAMSLAQAA